MTAQLAITLLIAVVIVLVVLLWASMHKSTSLSELVHQQHHKLDHQEDLIREMKFIISELQKRTNTKNPFSQEDIKRLIMLCHPDKHGGKKMAEDMTKKLLTIRD